MQNSATIVYCKEKENDRVMNKNYRMEEIPEDKNHKRQQSNNMVLHTQQMQSGQPLAVQNSNATITFKGLAKYTTVSSNGPTIGSTSTTPTNSGLPQSNSSNLSTVNKEASRVRERRVPEERRVMEERRIPEEKPLSGVHQQITYAMNGGSTIVQSRKP